MVDVTMHIEGMTCAHCLNAVNSALHEVGGVEVRKVQIGRAELSVPEGTNPERLVAAIAEAGFRATIAPEAAPSA